MKRLFSVISVVFSLLVTLQVWGQNTSSVCGILSDDCRLAGSGLYLASPNSSQTSPMPGHYWFSVSSGDQIQLFFRDENGGVFTENLPPLRGNQLVILASNEVLIRFAPSFNGNRDPEDDTLYNIRSSDVTTPRDLANAFVFGDNSSAICTAYPGASSFRITGFFGCNDGRLIAVNTIQSGAISSSEISTAPFNFGQTDLQFRFREIVIPANSAKDNTFAIVQDGSSRSVFRNDSVSASSPNNNIWVEVANFDESQNINNLRVVNTDLGEMVSVFSEASQQTVFTRGGVRNSIPCRIEGQMTPFGTNCRFTEGSRSNLVFLNFPDQLGADFTFTDVDENQRFPILVTMFEVGFSDGTFSSEGTLEANASVNFEPFPQVEQVDVPTENPGSPTTGSDTPMMVEEENVEIGDGPVLTTGTDGSGIDAGILGGLAVAGLVGLSIFGGSDDDEDSGIGSFGLLGLFPLLMLIFLGRRPSVK